MLAYHAQQVRKLYIDLKTISDERINRSLLQVVIALAGALWFQLMVTIWLNVNSKSASGLHHVCHHCKM